jgi:hypothetical protein
MEDDFTIIKNAFEKYIIDEYDDLEGNPVLKVKVGSVEITFYFNVDEYADKAYFDSVVVLDS